MGDPARGRNGIPSTAPTRRGPQESRPGIGNDAYTSLPVWSNAVGDARAMAGALRGSGFQVTTVENANREVLETAVQRFLDKLDRGDVALFYYSGHGLQIRVLSSTFGGKAMLLMCCLATVLALPFFGQSQGASDKKGVPDKPAAKPEQPSAKSPGAAGQTRVNPKDGQRYVWIPPGTFQMGCSTGDSECSAYESPVHAVTISRGFWLGQTEVTVAAFQAYSRSAGAAVAAGQKTNRHPVVNVTWDEAAAYCRWIGGRLPAEAEWEYAARGGVKAARYGALEGIAWYRGNSGSTWHEVATKKSNAYGLYDMLGNACEWVADWYDENYYKNSPASDPTGPSSGELRVLRGGSWYSLPRFPRASNRDCIQPSYRLVVNGFRCSWE